MSKQSAKIMHAKLNDIFFDFVTHTHTNIIIHLQIFCVIIKLTTTKTCYTVALSHRLAIIDLYSESDYIHTSTTATTIAEVTVASPASQTTQGLM